MDEAPWCYKWDGMDGIGSLGGARYRAPYGPKNGINDACSTVDIFNGCFYQF